MEIVYAAHTRSGVFMLDAEGVCRWAVAQPGRTAEKVPERIVGAQYLATLDLDAEGALVDLPRVGCPMLFAATDEKGRIRLVRTPPLLRFEDRREGATRRPLASKFDIEVTPRKAPAQTVQARPYEDDATPVAPMPRSSSIPPPPSVPPPSVPPPSTVPESLPVPLMRPTTVTRAIVPSQPHLPAPRTPLPPPPRTPLPPPPRARIAARIPPPPTAPLASTGSGVRAQPEASNGVQSIPVRVRAANMSLKRLARGR